MALFTPGELRRNQMNRTIQLCKSFLNDDRGQDLIEYALIAAALSLIAISAEASITPKIANEFNTITNNF
jgi:Flp pilus assembly pilin Flp